MILNTTKTDTEVLPNLRKAAMLLVVLGEQSSAQLLQQLNEDEVQKVSREVAKLTSISSELSWRSSTTSPTRAITWRGAVLNTRANC